METVRIEKRLPLCQWEKMTEEDIRNYLKIYHGSLYEVIHDVDEVVLVISAPSTWRYLILDSMLRKYRYM